MGGCGYDLVMESMWFGKCAGSGRVWRECAVQSVDQFHEIRRAVVWVVLQGSGTLMVV